MRLGHLQQAEADSESLPFDTAAAALANGLPIYTCNPADFEGIDELTVIAVARPG